MSNSSQVKAGSYQDFSCRFQRAQSIPTGKRGVIFIGNTRAGKSTLASAAAGSDMEILYDQTKGTTYIQPSSQQYKQLVAHCLNSVTEQPNFFPVRPPHNKYAIIDMPGYADSSRFREMINFHYIQTMCSNLDQVRFLIVINMQVRGEHFDISESDLKMMESFAEMFPDCKEVVGLVVNKLEHKGGKNLLSEVQKSLVKIFENVQQLGNYVSQPEKFKKFYDPALRNVHLVLCPPMKDHKNGEDSWTESSKQIRKQMTEMCNDEKVKFREARNLKTKLNIFRQGDYKGNKAFSELVEGLFLEIQKGFKEGYKFFHKAIKQTLEFVTKKGIDPANRVQKQCDGYLKQYFFEENVANSQIKRSFSLNEHDRKEKLLQSRLIRLFDIFFKQNSENDIIAKEQRLERIYQSFCKILPMLFLSLLQGGDKTNLKNQLEKYCLVMLRFIEQIRFIQKIVESDPYFKQKIAMIRQQLKGIFILTGDNEVTHKQLFPQLFEDYITIDVSSVFKKHGVDEALKQELIDCLKACKGLSTKARKLMEIQKNDQDRIDAKIQEVELEFLLRVNPPQLDKTKKNIHQLLKKYDRHPRNNQFRIALKIAQLLQTCKEPKKAIGLYLHLERHEDVLRILHQITENKDNRDKAVEWYSELASEYLKKKRWTYFETCIENAKKNTNELEELVALQQKLGRGAEQISRVPSFENISLLKKDSIVDKLGSLWNWGRIEEEVKFLKGKLGVDNKIKASDIVARMLR